MLCFSKENADSSFTPIRESLIIRSLKAKPKTIHGFQYFVSVRSAVVLAEGGFKFLENDEYIFSCPDFSAQIRSLEQSPNILVLQTTG